MSNSTSNPADVVGANGSFTFHEFGVSASLNLLFAAFFLLWFIILRTYKPVIYNPRRTLHPKIEGLPNPETGKLPPELPNGWFNWFITVMEFNDSDILKYAGTDALIFLQSMKYGVIFFFLIGIYNLGIILPINYFGKNQLEGFNRISIVNLKVEKNDQGFDLPWTSAHIISLYLTTAIFVFYFHRFYDFYLQLRINFLQQFQSHAYTILVENIPKKDATDEQLMKLFKFLYRDSVVDCSIVKHTGELEHLIKTRKKYLTLLEGKMEKFVDSKSKTVPYHKVRWWKFNEAPVDSILYYRRKVSEYNDLVMECAEHAHFPEGPSAFVTFNSLAKATAASQTAHSSNGFSYKTRMAPTLRGVIWDGLKKTIFEKNLRYIFVAIATFALVVFWAIPIGYVQSLTDIETIEKAIPWLASLCRNNQLVNGFIQGYLPTLIIRIFLTILPHICMVLSNLEGHGALEWIELSQIRKIFYFYFINVYLVSLISTDIFKTAKKIFENPQHVFDALGTVLITQSGFFINFLVLITFGGGFFLEISLIDIWLVYLIRWGFAKSKQEELEAYTPFSFDYGRLYAQLIFVYSVGITFSTLAPLIIPFCFLYCLVGYCIAKHQLVYIHKKTYESGGLAFPLFFNRACVALIVAQMAVFAFFLTRTAYASAFSILPLTSATVLFFLLEKKMRKDSSLSMSLKLAVDIDITRNDGIACGDKEMVINKYIHPCFLEIGPVKANEELFHATMKKRAELGLNMESVPLQGFSGACLDDEEAHIVNVDDDNSTVVLDSK